MISWLLLSRFLIISHYRFRLSTRILRARNFISLPLLLWQLFPGQSKQELTNQFPVKHKHTLLSSAGFTLDCCHGSANLPMSIRQGRCLTKILSGTMIHFALKSRDVCVCVKSRLEHFVHPAKGNRHMKVQHNVFLCNKIGLFEGLAFDLCDCYCFHKVTTQRA